MNKLILGFSLLICLVLKFAPVESIVCISGNGISPEGSDRITLAPSNQRLTCPATDTSCYRVTYDLSGKNKFVTLGCFPSGARDPEGPSFALSNEHYNQKVQLHVCTRDNCNGSNNLKISFLALSTLICFSLAKFFKF